MIIQWLSDNAIWLGSLGAIAGVIALFLPLLKRDSTGGSKVTAKNGSVAAGGNIENSTVTTNKKRR